MRHALEAQSAQRRSVQASGLYVGTFGKAYDGNTQGWASELGELVDYLDAA